MLQIVRKNFGLKSLALGLAVSAWLYFHLSSSPVIAAHFDQQVSVPITIVNQRSGTVVSQHESSATIAIETPRNGSIVKVDAIKAFVDLEDSGTGVYDFPIHVEGVHGEIKSLSPASLALTIDRLIDRTVPIDITYDRRSDTTVGDVQLDPRTAVLHGTAADLAQVASVRVTIPLSGRTGAYDAMMRPLVLDARNQEVTHVDFSPSLVRVRARFTQPKTDTKK
jgi:YbbR domain-containing protein